MANYVLGTIPDEIRDYIVSSSPSTDLKTAVPTVPDAPMPTAAPVRQASAPSSTPASGPAPTTVPAGPDPYATVAQTIMQGRQAANASLDEQLKAYEAYRAESEKLRSDGKPNWSDVLVDALAPIARGFAQTRAKVTPGMVARGITNVDMTSGIDKFMQMRELQKEKERRELEQRLGRLRDDLNFRGDISKQRASLFDYDVKAGEYGIRGRERAEDVAFRNKNLEREDARHAETLAVQRERMAADERIATRKTEAETAKTLREHAGKYGEESAKNLGETLFKMENDELYKGASKMRNSAETVIGLLDTAGAKGDKNGFAEIGALVQGLRALGDTGVISDSDMKRNIAGSLSAIEAWLAPVISSGAGGLTKDQMTNIRNVMETIKREAGSTVESRRTTYRDAFDRTEQLRENAARSVYGGTIPFTRLQGKDLDTAFNIGRVEAPPRPSPSETSGTDGKPSGTPPASYSDKLKGMTAQELSAEVGTWGNLSNDKRKAVEAELKRRGVIQ